MDAKDSLKIVLDALHELRKQHITRQILIDFVRGIESRQIEEQGLNTLETFGTGDKREDLHYTMVIDQALDENIIKMVDDGIVISQKGERFRKSPAPFILKEDIEDTEPEQSDEAMLENLVQEALTKKEEEEEEEMMPVPVSSNPSTARSQQMIHLIQAIDRKIPLDDYAEQMQMGFDEVLDLLEHLIERGTKIDISYFVDEVLEKECQDELFDYFDEVDGNVEKAIEEFYGIYQPEEIRLARLVWKPE